MERITGTLRVDVTLDDLPGQPAWSVVVARARKQSGRLKPGYAVFVLYWPDAGGAWVELGQHIMPDVAHLEACVIECARLAHEQGLIDVLAQECTVVDVWRRVSYD